MQVNCRLVQISISVPFIGRMQRLLEAFMSNSATEATNKKKFSSGFEPKAFRINDALKLLSISRSHLYGLALKGELRLIKVGNRTLIPATEIERLVNGGAND